MNDPDDLEGHLRRSLAQRADRVPLRHPDGPAATRERSRGDGGHRRSRHRPAIVGGVVAVTVAAAVVAILATTAAAPRPSSVHVTGTAPTTAPSCGNGSVTPSCEGVPSTTAVLTTIPPTTQLQAPVATVTVPGPVTTTSTAATSPATTTTPVVCDDALQVGNDGSVAPLFCADGRDNAAALRYYQGGNPGGWYPEMLRLPASATRAQVVAAMCDDLAPGQPEPSGVQTEQQAYELAARTNGWTYDLNVVYDDVACS